MSQELVPRGDGARQEPAAGGPVDAVFGFARGAAVAWFRTTTWGVGASIRLVRSSRNPRALAELASDVGDTLRELMRELLGVSDLSLEERIRRLLPAGVAPIEARRMDGRTLDATALRAQADELLRQAADVNLEDSVHPAYARILLELAPDEARILRLLATEGAQPAVDVRAIGLIGSGHAVAQGLNMVGPASGVRDPQRVPVYLDNLSRLGLIRFSSEPLEDPIAYQVLEAQPDVLGAVKEASRAKTVQRSIRLTPFGEDFCRTCLPPQRPELASDASPHPD